jgi:2-amino-4-hydroxy-6-hydroxymethyldihydropteridine diphosphokinase
MIIITLGSNVISRWGNPATTILAAFRHIEGAGIAVIRRSALYVTTPLGEVEQPDFVNAAAVVSTSRPPNALLSVLKGLEAKAGRKPARRWGPRALDLDIIDYKARIIRPPQNGGFSPKNKSDLILPHPEAHRRPFVLQPIEEIAPRWHHPVYGLTAAQFLSRLGGVKQGAIVKTVYESTGAAS